MHVKCACNSLIAVLHIDMNAIKVLAVCTSRAFIASGKFGKGMNRKDLGDDKTTIANITEMSIKTYVPAESVLVSRLSSGVQLAL